MKFKVGDKVKTARGEGVVVCAEAYMYLVSIPGLAGHSGTTCKHNGHKTRDNLWFSPEDLKSKGGDKMASKNKFVLIDGNGVYYDTYETLEDVEEDIRDDEINIEAVTVLEVVKEYEVKGGKYTFVEKCDC